MTECRTCVIGACPGMTDATPSNGTVLLVVEDDAIVREAVALVLSGQGREIVMSGSGEEALARMTRFAGTPWSLY